MRCLESLTKLRLVTLSPPATFRINSAKGLVFARNEEILRFAQNDNTDAQAVLLGTLRKGQGERASGRTKSKHTRLAQSRLWKQSSRHERTRHCRGAQLCAPPSFPPCGGRSRNAPTAGSR